MSCENCEESAYVIDKLAKLLAEIAVIVNGVEPHDTSWSYHDLPEKVRAQALAATPAQQPAAAVPAEVMLDALDEACKNSEGRRVSWYGYTQEQRIDVMRRAMLAATERKECKV